MATRPAGQLTLRGLGEELTRRIRELARREGISLNRAALRLLRRGAGLAEGQPDTVGDSLDDHIGTWTEEEAAEFDAAVSDLEKIDESLWQ